MKQVLRISTVVAGLFLGLMLLTGGARAQAEKKSDKKVEILLVWGTNDDPSANPKHKQHQLLEGEVAQKLKKYFKWKNYFQISKQVVPADGRKFQLSKHCSLQMKDIGGDQLEVDIWGKGKPVRKIKEKVTREEHLVVAGDDRNDSAWFILFKEVR